MMGTTGGDSGDGPVYSFFRSLRSMFGIPHRLEPEVSKPRDKALRIPSPHMYDDTNYADPRSIVQEYEQRTENNESNPSSGDAESQNSPPVPGPGGGREGFPFDHRHYHHHHRGSNDDNHGFDPFGFGSVFGHMDEFFKTIEKQAEDMTRHFDGFGFPGDDNDKMRMIPNTTPNLRDEVLKPGSVEGDESGSGDIVPSDALDSDKMTKQEPRPFFSRSYRGSSSINVREFSNGGFTKIYSQTIRDTPEGREITTFRQNPDGTTEKSTEIVPRAGEGNGDLPALPREGMDTFGDTGHMTPFDFIREFFRPRI